MKKITTRKIVLGLLMTLVLAFSVLGNLAEALTFGTSKSGDYAVVSINQPFTIGFSASLKSQASIRDSDNRLVAEDGTTHIDSSGYPGTWSDHDSNSATRDTFARTDGGEKVSESLRYHYNDEAIAISVSPSTLTLTKSGTTIPPIADDSRLSAVPTDTTASLYERAENSNRRLSNRVSLTGVATAKGKYTITITDITHEDDFPEAPISQADITFTIFVLEAPNLSRSSTIGAADGLSGGIAPEYGTVPLSVTLTGGNSTFARVEFEVIRGPGRLYEDKNADGKADKSASTKLTTFTNNLDTASVADVVLMPNRGTSHVRAWVYGNSPGTTGKSTKAIYSFGYSQLKKVSGDKQTGPASSRLEQPFVVQLVDSTGRTTIPGADITFTIAGGGSLAKDLSFPNALYHEDFLAASPTLEIETDSNGRASFFLVLGATGDQSVTATFGGSSETFTATIGETPTGTTRTPHTIRILSGTDGQRADENGQLENALIVVVRDQYGDRLPEATVEFEARDGGTILAPNSAKGDPGDIPSEGDTSDRRRDIDTNSSGEASVRYLAADGSGRQRVTATLEDGSRSVVTFTINGPPSTGGGGGGEGDDGDEPPPTITRTLDIDVSGTGSTRTVRVTALQNGISQTGINVTLTVSGAASLSGTSSGGTPLERTLTLPTTADTYTLRASTTASGYSAVTEDVEVTLPGTLGITLVGNQVNGAQTIQVTARNAAGSLETTAVTVTLSGAGISRTVPVTGSQNVPITLPTTSGTLTASATGYRSGSVTLPARSTGSTPQRPPQETTTGTASRVQIRSDAFPRGTVNTRLAQPLSVRVVDANGNGVSNVRVTFEVTSGRGRLSQRGNGRAIRVQTNPRGEASAEYTPLSASSTVRATAAGVSRRVTFTISTGSAPLTAAATSPTGTARQYNAGDKIPLSLQDTLSFTGSRTVNGTLYTCVGPGACTVSYGILTKGQIRATAVQKVQAKTYKVGDKMSISLNDTLSFTGSRTVQGAIYKCVGPGECVISYGILTRGQIEVSLKPPGSPPASGTIDPEVLVAAAQRPPMLWIDGGTIYALVGKDVQEFVADVDTAQNLTVDGSKVYWTEKTGERGGSINSANLDGTGATEITNILATPTGIAVDTARSKIYVANTGGRILSMNLDGSGIQTVRHNLQDPVDIALSGGNAYWTQANGEVRFVTLSGTQDVRSLSTGTDTAGSLVIAGGKVYWTKQTGNGGGTINSANLDGTGATQVASILAGPTGIAVDTARSKIYVANTGGRILCMNLDGSFIQTVVDGLGNPGDMVISNSITAPKTPASTATTATTASNKYDINGDGMVDSKDSDVLLLAVAADITDAKYDVNGDGKVDINDVVAVTENRDKGAAAAPALIGNIKLSAIQIDRLQEQIDLLIATGDRSPAALKTLVYLQQLIALARPEKTQLFANYPNPFNPETWIPYELATDTNVCITIYNARGVVVRTLHLGQQSAGYYTDRERAAYWDGRNALGEQVASGVYFYQFETDTMSSMRKMVILK